MSSAGFLSFPWLRVLVVAALCIATRAAALEPVRVVATGGRIGNTFHTPAAGSTAFRQRTPHKLGGPVAEMQVGFMDWMYPYANETPNDTNDVTIEHAWLERASTGQIVPLTFSGSRQLVLPKNSTTAYWLSDAIPSSSWTGATPAHDEVFWLHVRGSIPEGGKIPVGTPASYPGAKFITYPPANDTGAVDAGGPVPSITGSASRIVGLPLIFLGRFTEPGHLSVIGIGDSILDGSGDVTSTMPVVSGFGFFNRAAVDSNGANAIAMFNLTRHGQSASNFVKSGQTRHPQFLPFANVIVEEYGTNDLGSGGTGVPATILGNLAKIWSAARAAGVQKIIRTRLMARTASTDAWATLENQTPNVGWESGGKRDTINAGLETALDEGKIDILLDTLAVLAAPSDDSRWLTNGSARYLTTDGSHLGPTGNALLAPHLRAALLSLTVDGYEAWKAAIPWNGADSAPEADPDRDARANLLEYAFDTDPLYPSSDDNVRITNIAPALALSFPRLRHDLAYAVQASSDLVAWDTVATNPGSIGETVDVADTVPFAETPRRFLRLQITR